MTIIAKQLNLCLIGSNERGFPDAQLASTAITARKENAMSTYLPLPSRK